MAITVLLLLAFIERAYYYRGQSLMEALWWRFSEWLRDAVAKGP